MSSSSDEAPKPATPKRRGRKPGTATPAKKPKTGAARPTVTGHSREEIEFIFNYLEKDANWTEIVTKMNEATGKKKIPGNMKKHWMEVLKKRTLEGYAPEKKEDEKDEVAE